jgi:hypothetical protein
MVDTVLKLPPIAIVLSLDTGRVAATFGNTRLVDAADRFATGVLIGNHLLATISQLLFIPHDRFQKPLQRPRGHPLIQGNGLRILTMHARQQTTYIDLQQIAARRPGKATCETRQKLGKHSSEICDILNIHGATFRGFRVKQIDTRKVVSFLLPSQDR